MATTNNPGGGGAPADDIHASQIEGLSESDQGTEKAGIVAASVGGIASLALATLSSGVPGKASAEDVQAALKNPPEPIVLAANEIPSDVPVILAAVGSEGTPEVEVTNQDKLYGYLNDYIDPEAAADYAFYIDDMENAPYADLRIEDALYVLAMYEGDGILEEGVIDRNSQRVVTAVLAWFSTEQTPGGASVMETAIKRLHRISPETTKEAIAFAASVFGDISGDTLYSPWDTAVNVASTYGVEYIPASRSADLGDSETILAQR